MTKKNNPKDDKIEEVLHKVLGQYQEILFKAANSKKDEDVNAYKERFFQTMDSQAPKMAKAYSDVVLSNIHFRGKDIPDQLRKFGSNYNGNDILLTTYSKTFDVIVTSLQQYKDGLNQKILERQSKGGRQLTIMEMRDITNEYLAKNNVDAIEYANGRSVPVDKYAAMLARTTRAETENLSMIGQALREGIDLVECDIVSPTCDSCAVYQGRVYSISGKDKRYPALYQTAFKSGYSIIHPNCRHSWSPYRTELYSEEEKREALERSNRSWQTDGDGRHFQQTEKLRTEYAQGEQKRRQWNAEIVEHKRMKAYYAEQGQEPPYKTLGGFRKEVRKPREEQSPTMKAWKRHYADQQQYERWKEVIGTQNMPKTLAKFQKIKYNKKEEFALLKGYKEAQQKQDIHALVSFKTYKAVSREIDKALVGKTFDGITIKGKKTHFIDRVIGEYQESDYKQSGKRQGVKIVDVVDCLQSLNKSSRINDDGSISLTYESKNCQVTVNPETGILIQANPIKRRKRK